jgi:hypothetical protein
MAPVWRSVCAEAGCRTRDSTCCSPRVVKAEHSRRGTYGAGDDERGWASSQLEEMGRNRHLRRRDTKIAIAKRLRLRLDYRLFMLGDLEAGDRGPTTKYPQRFSAGLQLVL